MKNRAIKIGFVLTCLIAQTSCNNNDFLNTKPLDRIPSTTVWSDAALSKAFVFNAYSFLGYGGFEEQMLAAYTDEAMFTHAGRNINTFNQGAESPSNLAWRSPTYNWDNMYKAIRETNVAIINLPTATFTDQSLKDQLLGESYFLRAYYYQQLVRFYGGVPLVDKIYGLNDDYSMPRSTYDACVNFMLNDLDKAIALLDGKASTPGRTSKLAAMALKCRILLYAASDLHDIPTASAQSNTIATFAKKSENDPIADPRELLGYLSGSRTARWQLAKDAAKAVLDAGTGYKLNLSAPASLTEGKANYISVSMGGGSKVADAAANVELIFQRTETPLYTVENNWPLGGIHFGINNGPNGYHNWSGNTPIQQLVDDYEMMDGSKFDWNNPVENSDPYLNRDPRFYATVLFDGADWKPRPSDVASKDPANQIQSGYYDDGKGGTINGLDTRESVVENWNGSRTHYWVRKFIDPDPTVIENQTGSQVVPWPFLRYTEAVLNYVEACIELGDEAEAKTWLNKIRFRAGMPAITETGTALRDRYRNERRIELVYEEHRYHDARRWMIAPTTLGRGIKVMYVKGTLKPGKAAPNPYRYDKTLYNYTYTQQDNTDNEVRTWIDKMYFRPMDRNEINRNSKLIQNPGYD